MINYLLGGLIVGATILIIVKQVRKLKQGDCSCGHSCPGCNSTCHID